MVPVPYPIAVNLSGSLKPAKSVFFNGKPAYLLDNSSTPQVVGNAQGTGGGIVSGINVGTVYPIEAGATVSIEGKRVVRAGDQCRMNDS